jgi:hypothetical protein
LANVRYADDLAVSLQRHRNPELPGLWIGYQVGRRPPVITERRIQDPVHGEARDRDR